MENKLLLSETFGCGEWSIYDCTFLSIIIINSYSHINHNSIATRWTKNHKYKPN